MIDLVEGEDHDCKHAPVESVHVDDFTPASYNGAEFLVGNGTVCDALSFLVRLEDHRKEHGEDSFYITNKPVAWERAREALKSHYKAKSEG